MFPKLILIALCGCFAIVHATPQGKIIASATQQTLTPEQLANELARADIVLIGEQHDNIAHHDIQQWLLEHTAAQRLSGSVVLEMLTPEQQTAIDEVQTWLNQDGKTGKRSLAAKIQWNHAWDWGQYQNLMYTLLHQKARVLAGNPSKTALQQNQNFVPQGKASSDGQVRNALTQLIQNHHSNTQHLLAQQQYKDHTMSQVLLVAPKPAWLLAGNIHVSKQLGVPLHLRDHNFSGSLKVLILADKNSEVSAAHADYIWYLPH
ncbi:ChaN family lipoprotein [Neisseriaceae bacterium B1]